MKIKNALPSICLAVVLAFMACPGDSGSNAGMSEGEMAQLRQDVEWMKSWMGWQDPPVDPPVPPATPPGPMPVEQWHEALYSAFCKVEEAAGIAEEERFCHEAHDHVADGDHSGPPPTPPYGA